MNTDKNQKMGTDVTSSQGKQFLRLLRHLRSLAMTETMRPRLAPPNDEGLLRGPDLVGTPRNDRYICLCILSLVIYTTFLLFPLTSQAHIAEEWMVKEGYFCTLYIRQDVNIEALNRKIDTYRVDFGLSEKPISLGRKPQEELSYKFDIVFLKIQELLDMRPQDIRLNVKIYPNKEDIGNIYMEIFNEGGRFIAFYVFNLNTLFACEEKISVSVVAHEIAHCIVDHHFTVQPPKKIAELLAHYAELHLRD